MPLNFNYKCLTNRQVQPRSTRPFSVFLKAQEFENFMSFLLRILADFHGRLVRSEKTAAAQERPKQHEVVKAVLPARGRQSLHKKSTRSKHSSALLLIAILDHPKSALLGTSRLRVDNNRTIDHYCSNKMFPGPSLTPKTTTNGQTLSRLAELAEAVSKQQHSASVARLMTMNGNGLNASQQVGAVSLALRKRPAEMGGLPSAPVADPTAKRPKTASATGAPDQSGDDAEGEDLKDVRFREYQAEIWSEKFEDLCEFRRQYGHCHVPHTYTENAPLAQWVKRQRYQYKLKSEGKRSTLSDERVRLLDQIGFIWNSHDVVWEERWHELLAFKRGHGHCIVPSNYDKNPQLAVWVKVRHSDFFHFIGNV